MKLSREEVQHIALLARLSLTEGELDRMRTQLSNIIENFEALSSLDTKDVPATTHSVPLHNVFREDKVRPSCPVEDALANAPQREENAFKVRAVLE